MTTTSLRGSAPAVRWPLRVSAVAMISLLGCQPAPQAPTAHNPRANEVSEALSVAPADEQKRELLPARLRFISCKSGSLDSRPEEAGFSHFMLELGVQTDERFDLYVRPDGVPLSYSFSWPAMNPTQGGGQGIGLGAGSHVVVEPRVEHAFWLEIWVKPSPGTAYTELQISLPEATPDENVQPKATAQRELEAALAMDFRPCFAPSEGEPDEPETR